MSTSNSGADLEIATLPEQTRRVIIPDAVNGGIYPQSGRMFYSVREGEIGGVDVYSTGFDLGSMTPRGDSVLVLTGLGSGSASDNGSTVAYMRASGNQIRYNVVSVDRQGNEEVLPVPAERYVYPRLSPDGSRLALNTGTGTYARDAVLGIRPEIHIWDFASETLIRLSLGEKGGLQHAWSPDGGSIYYNSLDGKLSRKPANNARPPEAVTDQIGDETTGVAPHFLTPDGRSIVFQASQTADSATSGLGMISLGGDAQPQRLFQDGIQRNGAVLSPDGKWLAYHSTESGRAEVFVRPFPILADDLVQISNEGAVKPLWSRDGSELFYLGGNPPVLMSASVRVENGRLSVIAREPVFNRTWPEAGYESVGSSRNYDLMPDNEHFVVLKRTEVGTAEPQSSTIHVVLNWNEAIRQQLSGGQ